MLEYIQKFDELSRYAPHMVTTEDLKRDHFMQGLRKHLPKDLKVGGVRDASFNELINRALVIEQADEEKKEEKQKNKRSIDKRNFQANHEGQHLNNNRKGMLAIQDQNKSKRPKNHQKEVPKKPICNQCGRTHHGECRANTRTCFKCGISIIKTSAYVLINSGATHSFASLTFIRKMENVPDIKMGLLVSWYHRMKH